MMIREVLFLSGFIFLVGSCQPAMVEEKEEASTPKIEGFDSVLAQKYGADKYGMKKYIMAFLYRGENRETDSVKALELQRAHLQNIGKLAEEGKLVLAGPFLDDTELRGLYFFDVETMEEAKALTETDPAIQSGHLRMELKPWYGSAAMMGINEVHGRLSKSDVSE